MRADFLPDGPTGGSAFPFQAGATTGTPLGGRSSFFFFPLSLRARRPFPQPVSSPLSVPSNPSTPPFITTTTQTMYIQSPTPH